MAITAPAFEDTMEAEAPAKAPAFEETTEAEAPISAPAFEDTSDIAEEKPVVKPDTFADDWTGFVANMQIAGNRLLQSVTAARMDAVAKTQKSAQLARQAADTGTPEAFDAYAQDRMEELGMAAFPKRDSASISKAAEVLENRWRSESLKIPEFASYLAEKEQRIKQLTPSLSPEMQKFNEAKGAEFWKVFAQNPVEGLANVIASSAVISSPALAMGIAGSVAGPAGTAAGAGAGSYYVESANAMLDSLQAAGVDLSNKEQVEAAFTDPAVMEKAREFANKRGIPIAIFDAASAGIAGRFIGPLLKEGATATTRQVLAATGKEVLSQMVPGGTGEFTAQVVSGQEISTKDIALEALGEIGSAITEGYSNVRARQRIDAELAKAGTTEPPAPTAPETPLTQVPPVVQEDIYTAPPTSEADVFAGVQPKPAETVKVSPFKPQKEGRSVVSTAIRLPTGEIVTGTEWNSAHQTMVTEALDRVQQAQDKAKDEGTEAPPDLDYDNDLGFIIQDEDGNQRFATREEALEIARETGQVDETKLTKNTKGLQSEGMIPFKGGEQPGAVQEQKPTEVYGGVPQQPVQDEGRVPAPEGAQQVPQGSQERGAVPSSKVTMTEDEAANQINKYREAAIALAKRKGATDLNAEDIFQKVLLDLTPKLASGDLKPTSIAGLVNQGITFATSKEIKPTVKGGEGITVSGDIEGPTGKTAITEAATTRGPRAEAVSQEDIQTIEQAIESLPESERNVMKLMVDNPGMSDAEIGAQVGLTENAVRQAKFRARNKLKEFIKNRGIGERMAPGAANEKEFQRARYIAGTDIYLGLESAGQLSRETWERQMERIYEDAFTPEQLDDAWRVVQIAAQESKDTRKPIPSIISQMMGVEKGREGITALKNVQADREREARGLPAAHDAARRTQPSVWDEAMRENDETNGRAEEEVIDKLRADFRAVLNDKEIFHLLHAKIDAQNRYDEAVEQVNSAQTQQERLIAMDKARKAESDFIELLDLSKMVGSEQGRAFAARKFLVSRDYSPLTLTAELQAAQFGEELTDEQKKLVTKVSKKVNESQSEFDAREEELEGEESDKALEEKFKEFQKQPILDSRILAIANKIVAKLDAAADKARERLKGKLFTLNAGIPNPTILYDLAVIGASKIAHGLRDVAWRTSMRNEFGEGINPYLDDIYKQSDQMIDNLEEDVPEADRPKVRNVVRKTGNKDVIKDTEEKIKARIEDGESLNDLRSYVQKIALALVRSGVDSAQDLVDAVHPILQKFDPSITKRQTADLISGYGDFKALNKEKSMVKLRDFKTQLQQLSKLQDIAARKPLSKTGIERQAPSDLARRLIREVNELKRRIGTVVTDPTKQLRSAMDSIKTSLKNQIRDLTHQIETGEKPIPGTPTPTDAEIDALKATRDRVKQTLAEIEGTPEQTMEQRVAAAERALERLIEKNKQKIKNKDVGPAKTSKIRSDRLDALRAENEALTAELDALRAADQDFQDTKEFDRLMKEAAKLQDQLDRGVRTPKTKAEKIEDDLVKEARKHVTDLRQQLHEREAATSEAQQKKLDAAIAAVERSIAAYDRMLKTGAVAPTPKAPGPSSPLLDKLRKDRDALYKLVQKARKPKPLSPEQRAIKNLIARTKRQNAQLKDRIARGDFATRTRKTIDYSKDPEAVRILAENTKWIREFEKAKYEAMLKGQSALEKVYRGATQTLHTAKASVGSVDLSAFARQAGPAVASHPLVGFKNLIKSVMAMNEKRMNATKSSIELRPNARNGYYRMMKLALTQLDGPLGKREEEFRSDWAEKIPWIRWSNRQFTTFLNLMRADLADMMIAAGPTNPTPEQLRAFGRAVNILTGRGEFGKFEGATDFLAIPFWSPRLYASRIQTLIGMPIWQKDARGVRGVIAKEYMRMAASGVGIVLLGLLAGADIEWDPESSDFLKLRFGKVRIDPWAGQQQWLVFLYRMLTGKYETTKGKKFDLDYPGKRPGPYDPTYGDTATRMFRSKLQPIAQGAWEFQTGRDINGDPVSKMEALGGMVLPLSVFNDDIVPIAEEYGLDKAAAAEALNMIGVGVQHYGKDKKN